jgi:hypothetical protein
MTKPPTALAEEVREQVPDKKSYRGVIDRLNKASVDKHWEAYADIPWDHPDFAVDINDPRWVLPSFDGLGSTQWYKDQPPQIQAQIGLWRVATAMKVGLQFENLLKRGLLNYAYHLPNGRPEFRYVYHETTEECHHGMMFQEFVNRSGFPIKGMPRALRSIAQLAPFIPLVSTELFFIFVLGGEDPIDHVQRRLIKSGEVAHPLSSTIMKIHIAEEARHISFARHYLRHRVPGLPALHRHIIGILAPVILGVMARIMLAPPGAMVRHFGIPREVVAQAYRDEAFRQELRDCVGKVRDLAAELNLITGVNKRIWQAFGIWDTPKQPGRAVA